MGPRTIHLKGSYYQGPLKELKGPALYNRPLLGNNRLASNLSRPSKQRLSEPLPLGPRGRGNRLKPTTIAARKLELENDA